VFLFPVPKAKDCEKIRRAQKIIPQLKKGFETANSLVRHIRSRTPASDFSLSVGVLGI